jgi:O-antigen/teichoic acid export membrane protein
MMRRPIINTAVQILGKAGGIGISLITTGILTRKLGLDSYGNFILVSSLFVFLDSLADFGTKTIGVREISKDEDKEVLGHIFSLRMIMATLAFCLGLGLVWSWQGLKDIRVEATVAMLMIFLTSIAGYWEIIFQSRLRMDLKVVMDLCFPTVFLVWLWWWKGEISLLMVFSVYLGARLFSLAAGFWLVKESWRGKIIKLNWGEIRKLWKMTWPMGVFLIMFATYDRAIDSLLIQNFLGAAQVAWYGLAYKVYGALVQPAYFYVNSIFPMMSSSKLPKKKLFWTSMGLLMTGAVILVVIVYLTAPWMIQTLAGESYGPSVAVLRILILAALFSYAGHLVGFTLISRGGQGEMLKLGAVALSVNLILNILLIPRYGILAAAWVTVLTEMIDCGMMGWFLWKKK